MRTRTRTILAGSVLVASMLGGVAWATGTTSSVVAVDGTINGCYRATDGDDDKAGKGQLRVVADGETCKKDERAIKWSQQGPKGDRGPVGLPGSVGPKGDPGVQGPAGSAGAKGEACLAIEPACVGPKGETGMAGANGANGKDGADGKDGAKGEACLPDTPGCRGPKGDKGEPGPAGADGAPCPPSNPACVGPQGPAGSSGGGGFTTTRVIVPLQSSAGPDVFNVLETSSEWGTIEAICEQSGVSTTPTGSGIVARLAFYLSSTATDAHLYRQGVTSYDPVVPRPTVKPGWTFSVESRADVSNFGATTYRLVRFGTSPDGSPSVTERALALAGEILPNGSCRATIALENI